MIGRCLSVFAALIFAIAVSPVNADDAVTPTPAKSQAAKAKHKHKPKSADPMDLQAVQFSDPAAPLGGHGNSVAPSQSAGLTKEPAGGPSLDLKWHAENHINNPYWEPWVPNGQGQGVEAGVKVGF
jgi:hypothetical protein